MSPVQNNVCALHVYVPMPPTVSPFQSSFVTVHAVSWKKPLSTTDDNDEDPNNCNANISMLTRSQSNAN